MPSWGSNQTWLSIRTGCRPRISISVVTESFTRSGPEGLIATPLGPGWNRARSAAAGRVAIRTSVVMRLPSLSACSAKYVHGTRPGPAAGCADTPGASTVNSIAASSPSRRRRPDADEVFIAIGSSLPC